MTSEFGGMQVADGSANVRVLSTGTELSAAAGLAWALIAAATHGAASVVPNITTGRTLLKPGVYKVDVDLSVENNDTSGESSEDQAANPDQLDFYLARGETPFPTEIAGTKTRVAIEEGLPVAAHISAIIEITHTMLVDAENYVSLWAKTTFGGGSSTDVRVSQARLIFTRLD